VLAIGDIAAYEQWPYRLERVDAVVHLAGRAHVVREAACDGMGEFRRVNVEGTLRLARAAATAGVRRFVFVSSIGVNGVRTYDRAFREADAPNPTEPYAISKWEAEQGLLELGTRTSLEITRVRPPLIVGRHVKGNLRRLLQLVDRGIPLPFASIRNLRSYVALEDLCELLLLSIDAPRAAGELFLVADPHAISTPELLRHMAAGLQRRALLVPAPPAMLRLAARVVGMSKEVERIAWSLEVDARHASEVLGWHARIGLPAAIAAMAHDFARERIDRKRPAAAS
jgi:nucleoside-diphosphate-sugar epimerase